eukprot:14192073-Ditylum_brightwellii.AAC.1
MQKYCTMCEADGSNTLEARCDNEAVRTCVWQEVCKWREIYPVAKETCVWQEICKWHEMHAAAKKDCKVMRVCEKQAFVGKNNMNKIEMEMQRGQLKETEPHKVCEPGKHQKCVLVELESLRETRMSS